jgi:hypothetical protein
VQFLGSRHIQNKERQKVVMSPSLLQPRSESNGGHIHSVIWIFLQIFSIMFRKSSGICCFLPVLIWLLSKCPLLRALLSGKSASGHPLYSHFSSVFRWCSKQWFHRCVLCKINKLVKLIFYDTCKKFPCQSAQWHMPIILGTREAEMERMMVWGQPTQKFSQTHLIQ